MVQSPAANEPPLWPCCFFTIASVHACPPVALDEPHARHRPQHTLSRIVATVSALPGIEERREDASCWRFPSSPKWHF